MGVQIASRQRRAPALTLFRSSLRYLKTLTARAITNPKMTSEANAWIAIASLAQRASGITSVGLKAVEFVKPR